MSSIGTVILLKIFPALLPPINEEDRDFYALLDLEKGSSESDIRKAYKQKSLALHPDKIAQRRASAITAEEAAKEYQLVQEAHTCLSDKASRQKYHAVQCSPTRYRFLQQEGGLSNQTALLKNLSHASFGDKTRLVLFVSVFPALVLVQPILIAVKVNHVLAQEGALEDAPWMALLTPWWILHGLFVIFQFGISFIAPEEARFPILSTAVEQLLWLIAFICMALRWDNTITADYAVVFIPVYLALAMKWFHTVLLLQQISKDMSKMVSKDHFLTVILHGREPEELEEEELKELHDKYVVVSQIPADIQHELENDEEFKNMSEEEREEIRVSSSREFEAALEAYGDARRSMIMSVVLEVAFLVLLILKVDNRVDMSWWLVFLPILVAYGLRILHSCFICCCLSSPMDPDEVVVLARAKEDLEANENGENEDIGESPTNENENNDKPSDEKQDGAFAVDSEVILHSLNTAEFNGKIGVVKGPKKDGRQEVYIQELDKCVALKVANLKDKDETETIDQSSDEKLNNNKLNDVAAENGAPKTDANATEKKEEQAAAQLPNSTASPCVSAEAKNEEATNKTPIDGEKSAAPNSAGTENEEANEGESEGAKDDDDDDDDDDISIHIDPETYRAYQSAYAAAEQNVMEDRVKAGQDNCIAIVSVTMICLLVAKLEQAYEAEKTREEEDDAVPVDVGFNTLWLIFPLFLVVGFMICCCACLIYGAPDPDELMHHKDDTEEGGEGDEEANAAATDQGETTGETPIVFAPPPPQPTEDIEPAVEAAAAEEAKANGDAKADIETEEAHPSDEEEGDINDLD